MNPELAAVLITAVVSIGGSWLIARQTNASQSSQQLSGAWDRIHDLEDRVNILEDKRAEDALVKRRMGDYIDVLQDHIWKGKPPPPPQRPAGV